MKIANNSNSDCSAKRSSERSPSTGSDVSKQSRGEQQHTIERMLLSLMLRPAETPGEQQMREGTNNNNNNNTSCRI